jgi:hypothetical protein
MSKVSAYRRELNLGETVYVDYPASPWHYLVGKVIGIASGARYKVEFRDRGSDTVWKTSSAWFSLDRLVLGGELAPDLSQMGVQMVSEVEKPIVKTVAVEPDEEDSYRVPHPGDVGKKVWVRDQEDPTADDGVWFERTLVAVLPDAQPGDDSHRCFVCSSNGKDAHSVCHTWRFARILKGLSVKPQQPEPVIKDSLTTESNCPEIPDSSNSSETPNSSVDNHSVDASKMVMDGPTEKQQMPDVHETDFANMQNEKITIGYTVPNAYDTDAEPITEPIQRKRVLYIAGPMRGVAWFNYPLFDRVAKELRDAGNEVISPADEDRKQDGFSPYANPEYRIADACVFPHEMDFGKTVRRCLEAVLRCDEIVLLPGWENSNGAVAELTLAMWLNKRVRHVNIDDDNRLTFACYWTSLISLAVQLSEHHMPKVERMGLAEQDDEDEHSEKPTLDLEEIAFVPGSPDEDILAEASRITRGSRQSQYGPPDQDFRRTAGMWSALFISKLKDGVTFEPRDVALAMILLKTSRETHQRKRDNWVDIAGYASCGSRCS